MYCSTFALLMSDILKAHEALFTIDPSTAALSVALYVWAAPLHTYRCGFRRSPHPMPERIHTPHAHRSDQVQTPARSA